MIQNRCLHPVNGFIANPCNGLLNEFITDSPNRLKMNRTGRIFFEVLPESNDKVIDSSGRWINIITPYGFQNMFP
jgi:hypothetical protein